MKQVLIVDDDDTVSEFVKVVVEREGFEAVVESDGVKGLQAAQANPPALIIADIMMPRMDGYQMVRKLQETQETRPVPVLLVSSRTLDQSTKTMLKMESNVRDFVEKPIRAADLSRRLHEILD